MSHRKFKYLSTECSHAWFRYGFMEYTGERPKIGKRVDAFRFILDGVEVEYKQKNLRDVWEVECPQCKRPVRSIHKWPEDGARWGCKKCVPYGWVRPPISLYAFLKRYSIDKIMKMTQGELRRLCGVDAIKMVYHLITQPEAAYKSVWSFRPIDRLQWRTDDARIPCIEKLGKKRPLNSAKTNRKTKVEIRMQKYVHKALVAYAEDNGMSVSRCANALIRWALSNQDIVQIRPI